MANRVGGASMLGRHESAGRGWVARLRRRVGRSRAEAALPRSPDLAEPCLGCGEETAVGSVFYSDRLAMDGSDGHRGYLCSACIARVRAAKGGEPVTEHDLEVIADNGLMVGANLLGLGGF